MPSSSAISGARGTMSRAVELLACLRFAARKTSHASCSISSPTPTPEHPPPPRPLSTFPGICTLPSLADALWAFQRLLQSLLLAGRFYLRCALSQGSIGQGKLRDDGVCPLPGIPFLAQYRAKVADLLAQILDQPPHLADAQGVVSHCFQEALAPETLQAIVHSAGRY